MSAGRVQSVAVRLVVEREREISAFTAREYWTIEALLDTAAGERFAAEVVRIDGAALDVSDEATAERHRAAIAALHPIVTKVGTRTQKRSPAPPFTTSTLQQEASRSSASARSGRCRSPSGCTKASRRPRARSG